MEPNMTTKPSLTSDPNRRQKVQSAEYVLSILKALANAGGSLSLTALSEALEASPSKVHRYLASLKESGFVFQDSPTAHYVLGQQAITVGLAAMRQANILTASAPTLCRIAEEEGVTALIAILGNSGPTIVRWEEPIHAVTVNVRPGSTLPILWSATGRVFGAFVRSAFLDLAIRRELRTATSLHRREFPNISAVNAAFKEIRSKGYAGIRDVLLNGVSAVAAPVFDATDQVCGALAILGTSSQVDITPGAAAVDAVLEGAASITTALGGKARRST